MDVTSNTTAAGSISTVWRRKGADAEGPVLLRSESIIKAPSPGAWLCLRRVWWTTTNIMCSTRLGVFLTVALFGWSLGFVLVGSTASGHQWYSDLTSRVFDDVKGGLPILNICLPVLISASVAALVTVQRGSQISALAGGKNTHKFPSWMHRLIQRWNAGSGDMDFDTFALIFVLVPLTIFLMASIHRHLYGKEKSLDDQLMDVGNCFGMVALVAFAYLLIPVTRHSALLKLLRWDPVAAVRLHIWSGRIIAVAVLVHGIFHAIRWKYLAGESMIYMIFPPGGCWTLAETDFEPQCVDDDTDCSCYHLFRNLTGVLALVTLFVIGITSLHYVRRHHYRIFYMAHVLAGPTVIIVTVLHWNRSIVYMAPSILYYAASSAPTMVETKVKVAKKQGVKIVSVEKMTSAQGRQQRPCISITMEASDVAMQNYRPAQYIRLLAPDLDFHSHPFTVNRVVGHEHQLRVMFRAMGPFTNKLADRLVHDTTTGTTTTTPLILVDGFYGKETRVQQVLKHDVAILVAGGIGITPYLTLLHDVKAILSSRHQSLEPNEEPEMQVILHWSCRDPNLIQYVRTQYFEPLMQDAPQASNFRMGLIVHNTNVVSKTNKYTDETPESTPESDETVHVKATGAGTPFTPTYFSTGTRTNVMGNVPFFFTFSVIAWLSLWATWYLYINVIEQHVIMTRGWTIVAIGTISVLVSIVANVIVGFLHPDKHCAAPDQQDSRLHDGIWWTSVHGEEDRRIELSHMEEGTSEGLKTPEEEMRVAKVGTKIEPVTYEEKVGRPTVHELLKGTEGAQCPGLFACGPAPLMQELKSVAEERCLMRVRHCIGGTPQIAIYEETFEP